MPETNKYQWAIYSGQRLDLHDLETEFFNDKTRTKAQYKDNLLCPGCEQVQLSIKENANGIYLSAYPNSIHGENCDYTLDSATKRELVEYYKRIDADLAKRLLQHILEDRTPRQIGGQLNNLLHNDEEDEVEFVLENLVGTRKYLPRRSLNLRKLEESDHLIVYYGECRVFLIKHNISYYLRIFQNNNSNKYLCGIKISETVYSYLRDDLQFIPQGEELNLDNSRTNSIAVKIAFVSTMQKHSNYYNAVLSNSKLLKVIQL